MFFAKSLKENKGKYFPMAVSFFSLVLFVVFSFYHFTKFVTADEHYWLYERIPQYWNSLRYGELKDTLINDKPGVSLALISGTGLFFAPNPENHVKDYGDGLVKYDYDNTERIYSIFRTPIIIFNALALLYVFWVMKRIFSSRVRLLSIIGISLSPILVGISQVLNPDALFWSLSFCSIVSYFALLKTSEKKFIFFSGIFLGLSMITKYVADFFFPFFFFLFLSFPVFSNFKKEEILKYFKKHLAYYWMTIAVSFLVIVIFLPAVIVKPIYLYRLTIGFRQMPLVWSGILLTSLFLVSEYFLNKARIALFVYNFLNRKKSFFRVLPAVFFFLFFLIMIGRGVYPGGEWELFQKIPFDFKNLSDAHLSFLSSFFLEMNPLVFTVTPVIILGLFMAFVWGLRKGERNSFYIFSLSSFVFLFEIASMSAGIVNTVRYSVILFPILILLSSFGYESFFRRWKDEHQFDHLLIPAVLVVSILVIFNAKPFYSNYTNFTLPHDQLISDAWGYGGYEAAQRLNSLPDADKMVIWADYYGVCEFFKGTCVRNYRFDQNKYPISYFVLNRRGEINYNEKEGHWNEEGFSKAFLYRQKDNLVWNLEIGGREGNYVNIYKSN